MKQYNYGRKLLLAEHMHGCVSKDSCYLGRIHCIPELLPSQIEKDENYVQCVYQLNTSLFINPFSDNMELISLSSGLIPIKRAAANMLEAESKGKTEVLKFIDERFVNQSVDFFSPLEWLKLGSYTTILEKPVKIKSGKDVQSSTQSDIAGKIATIQ